MPDEEATACELDATATVYERWSWVQDQLPAIGKDSVNKQQGFNYRGIDAVLNKLKPLLGKAGVFIMPARQKATYEQRSTAKGTVMHVCKIDAMWQIHGVGGDHFTAETVGEASDIFDKATSKAQTAAFKYLLWPGLAIAENEDNDGQTPEETVHKGTIEGVKAGATKVEQKFAQMNPPPDIDPSADPVTPPQINKIRLETRKLGMAEAGTEVQEWVDGFGDPGWPGALNRLTKWQASRLIDELVK
jgi:hypothetical protein